MATANFGNRKVNFAMADVPSVHQVGSTVDCSNNPQPEHMVSSGKSSRVLGSSSALFRPNNVKFTTAEPLRSTLITRCCVALSLD